MKKIEIKTQIKENCYKIVNKKLKQNLQEDMVLEESWDEILKTIGDVSQYVAAGALLIPGYGRLISRIASGTAVGAHATRALTPDTSHPGRVEGKSQAGIDAIVPGLPFFGGRAARGIFNATGRIPAGTIGRKAIRGAALRLSGQRITPSTIPGMPPTLTPTKGIRPYDIVTTAIAPVAIENANPLGPRSERKTVYKGGQTIEQIRGKETGRKPIDWGSVANTLAYTLPFAAPVLKGLVFKR